MRCIGVMAQFHLDRFFRMEVNIPLGVSDANAFLAAEAVDAQPDFTSDVQRIFFTDIDPKINPEVQRVVTKCFKKDLGARGRGEAGLVLHGVSQKGHDLIRVGTIIHSHHKIETMMRIGQSPVRNIFFKEVAIGDKHFNSVKFLNCGASRAEAEHSAPVSIHFNHVPDFHLTFGGQDHAANKIIHQSLDPEPNANGQGPAHKCKSGERDVQPIESGEDDDG